MSDIRPFRALRPRPELAARVASYPYDVISSDEARELAKGNHISFLHVGKPEIDLPREIDLYDDRVYAKGAAQPAAPHRRRRPDPRGPSPGSTSTSRAWATTCRRASSAACSCQEYEDGLIKRHEFTRKDKEDDRTRHIDELNANATRSSSPTGSATTSTPWSTGCAQAEPVYDFVADDGIGHTVWVVDDRADRAAGRGVPGDPGPLRRRRPPPHRRGGARRASSAGRRTRTTPATSPTTTSWRWSSPTTSSRSWTTTGS